MKITLYISVLIMLFFSSCKKENFTVPADLVATWQWDSSTGGFAYSRYTPQTTGKNIVIQFLPDYTFKQFVNDTLRYTSGVKIEKSSSIFNHQQTDIIVYENSAVRQSFSIQKGLNLLLRDEVCDGFNHYYHMIH